MTLKRSMAPVGSDDAVLLILGSLPGEASLAAQRYYAHPQNQFWRLLGDAIGEPLPKLDYDARLVRLAQRGIAVWDVVAEARRTGSLDSAIRDARPNPLAQFVAAHLRLRAVAFNGQAAAKTGRAELTGIERLTLVDLPSSSPTHMLAIAEKSLRWAALGPLVLGGETATLGR